MQMDERKKKILRAIVQDYVNTAEPVGSRTIARKFDLGISPATIRNEMSDIEDLGLIEQPHTSSGRIPSDAGYRYYVDCLMEKTKVSEDEKEVIERETTQRIAEIQSVISHSSKLLSELTHLTSIVVGPDKGNSAFSQMHFLPYQSGKAIMVVVKENGVVENQIVEIGENVTAEELQRIANLFNHKMRGHSMTEVKRDFLHEIYNELSRQRYLIDHALELLTAILDNKPQESNKVYLGGTLNMLNQPEFQDVEKIKNLFQVFEEGDQIKQFLRPKLEGITVTIGGENIMKELKDCSVITGTYCVEGEPLGTIGLIGPTRMDYGKSMAMVEYMTRTLTELLTKRRRK
ncbi:heat-inducible transcriptional repressor HrcA [Desulfitobacterium sp. THU1]|uniref:heat-inducible transcriptional repressor HrcA n=1 Tax=Desulfitobacterium sp. THU1 TaxID=3138072 RepID=UPI00311E3A0F